MRVLKRSFFLIIILLVLPVTPVPCIAGSDFNHIGKFCFTMVSNGVFNTDRSLQLDLYSYSGRNYPVYGKVVSETREAIIPIYGTAVKDGENIIITLTGSESWGGSDEITIHAVVGGNGGEYNTIEHGGRWDVLPPGIIISYSDGGSLATRSCP